MGHVARNLVLMGLSVGYLVFELAFNARLLDVVGAGASSDEVHAIEVYGRSLSGIAFGLMVFGFLWKLHATGKTAIGWMGIGLVSILVAVVVYVCLEWLVNDLTRKSSPEFRRASLSILLVQGALVDGTAALDGLTVEGKVFSTPQGKVLLALFPAMAVSVDRLDEKIRTAKQSIIEAKLREELGGVKGFHERYQDGVDDIRSKFSDYQRLPTAPVDTEGEVSKQQDKAWDQYLLDLGKRGWTPSIVPPPYHGRVRQEVQKRTPVPNDWAPSDEAGFRLAVAQQVRKRLDRVPGANGVSVGGKRIAPGLSWPAFFAHAGVQSLLRERLELPASTTLLPIYDSASAFNQAVVRPMVRQRAAKELQRYEAPLTSFAPGGTNEEAGLDAARAALVPPLALFFSLLGALLHLGKLTNLGYQVVRAKAAQANPRWTTLQGWLLFGLVVAACLASLRVMDNEVTQSPLYRYMHAQLLDPPTTTAQAVSHAIHIVVVGQALSYPYNETLRTRVLGGITYGYRPSKPE